MQEYCRYNIPAVLKDREEDMRQVTALFNPGRCHTVLFVYGNERGSLCHVHINTLDYSGSLSVPFTGIKVTIHLNDLANAYDTGVEITGTAWSAKRDGYDFMINTAPSLNVLEKLRRMRLGASMAPGPQRLESPTMTVTSNSSSTTYAR